MRSYQKRCPEKLYFLKEKKSRIKVYSMNLEDEKQLKYLQR